MKRIELLTPDHSAYPYVCSVAQRVYHERLSVTIAHFPQTLFGVFDEDVCTAAMGLHNELTADMFRHDHRVQRLVAENPSLHIAEQGIFFTLGCPAAVPLLIATVAEYAHYAGFTHVIYAAIPVSARTIEHLGYTVLDLGLVDLTTFPADERHNYVRWHTEYCPRICLLNTSDAPERTDALPQALVRRISLAHELHDHIALMRSYALHPAAA